ncbi:MAG TPA: prepilin-type N-terminal cleavage/methylation domain-containing protein [Terriglobales bacterium]|nr:prepilin-type N-terminal cleavage/methylation domain-containing protein [Terriglobales bacterium]
MVKRANARGFTLVELMVVISIILVLISVAVPIYQQTVVRARESVLKQDLQTMRELIQQYTLDKQRAPQSLQDLVAAGYLRELPMDPITRSRDTWVEVQEDTLMSVDQSEPGIVDVHSGSELVSSEGTPYSEW